MKLPLICGASVTPWTCGSVMTSPSRTIANWLRGRSSGSRRSLTFSNFAPAVLLNLMSTTHWPVLAPVLVDATAATALVTEVPDNSTGPRMNFSVPVESQVMSGFESGARFALTAALPLQLKSLYWAWSAGVT